MVPLKSSLKTSVVSFPEKNCGKFSAEKKGKKTENKGKKRKKNKSAEKKEKKQKYHESTHILSPNQATKYLYTFLQLCSCKIF